MHTLIVICAFCKKFLDIKDGQGVDGTSHGACPECLKDAMDVIKSLKDNKPVLQSGYEINSNP